MRFSPPCVIFIVETENENAHVPFHLIRPYTNECLKVPKFASFVHYVNRRLPESTIKLWLAFCRFAPLEELSCTHFLVLHMGTVAVFVHSSDPFSTFTPFLTQNQHILHQ